MGSKKTARSDPAYIREQGQRETRKKKLRKLSFSLTKLITTQGQTIEEWEKTGLLSKLTLRLKFVGQFSEQEAIQNGSIKQYSKVTFPPRSGFTPPKHIGNVTWVVMHLTNTSKEVVVGYIENDIFYIIFFDQDHKFWPSRKKKT